VSGGAATERLYYTDAYLSEFSARVVDSAEDGKRVYLDRTAFYPTSGGQHHDHGTLAGQAVTDVVDETDRVAHVLAAPIAVAVGQEVRGKVDWTRRFDNMQQHTGQHLLSAVFDDLFGARTVSVHFGDEESTVDIAGGAAQLEKAQRRANLLIAENRPVAVTFEDAAAAAGLRKPSDRQGTLRIISIDGVDRSACGGTHVRATGEIGAIVLLGSERIREATRVRFVCGLRAVERASADHATLAKIGALLSTAPAELTAAVERQSAQLKDAEQTRRRLERDLAKYRAAELHAAAPVVGNVRLVVIDKGVDAMDQLQTLSQALLEHERVVFIGATTENKLLVAAGADSGQDAGKLLKDAIGSVGGKGGGSSRAAQGSAPAGKIPDAIAVIRRALEGGR
jgi:alanyl-tRNA synthetase